MAKERSAAEIVVIGGGMAGISAAALLAQGGARVTVVEVETHPGTHATGRSAAIFILNYGGPVLRRLNAAARPFFEAPDLIGEAPLLTQRGELLLCGPGDEAAFAAYLDGASGMRPISPAEAVGMVPILRPERLTAAAFEPAALDIDVDRMLQGYLRLLRAHGGQLLTKAPVTQIARDGDGWVLQAGGHQLRADLLINAAGGWADRVAAMAGVAPKGLTPLRRSAALIPAPEGHDVSTWPMFASARETWYCKPEAGKLMVSPADEDPVEPHDVWPEDMVLAEGLARFEEAVTIEVTRVEHRWAGMRTFALDRVPVVGFDPDTPDFFWLAGQGGYGIQTAPALSRMVAALILGRDDPEALALADATSPARFSRGG